MIAEKDKRYDESKHMHDIRVLPITFHANNTFSIEGVDKILRGRYGICGEERDSIWFQVSLFGAGRSVSGSVYSEGRGMTHDDRRGYKGAIQKYEKDGRTLFHIQGEVYYGNEMGLRKRPLPMEEFSMQETTPSNSFEDIDGSGLDSIFQ